MDPCPPTSPASISRPRGGCRGRPCPLEDRRAPAPSGAPMPSRAWANRLRTRRELARPGACRQQSLVDSREVFPRPCLCVSVSFECSIHSSLEVLTGQRLLGRLWHRGVDYPAVSRKCGPRTRRRVRLPEPRTGRAQRPVRCAAAPSRRTRTDGARKPRPLHHSTLQVLAGGGFEACPGSPGEIAKPRSAWSGLPCDHQARGLGRPAAGPVTSRLRRGRSSWTSNSHPTSASRFLRCERTQDNGGRQCASPVVTALSS